MTRTRRLGSVFLDHTFMACICVPILWLGQENNFLPFAWVMAILIYTNKDFLNGRSLVKKMLGFRIINSKTGLPANFIQCFIRNLTFIVWPVEVAMLLINPTKRIGDYIAQTQCDTTKIE